MPIKQETQEKIITIKPAEQDSNKAVFCGLIKKEDGLLDPKTQSAATIYNQYRAYKIFPRSSFLDNRFDLTRLVGTRLLTTLWDSYGLDGSYQTDWQINWEFFSGLVVTFRDENWVQFSFGEARDSDVENFFDSFIREILKNSYIQKGKSQKVEIKNEQITRQITDQSAKATQNQKVLKNTSVTCLFCHQNLFNQIFDYQNIFQNTQQVSKVGDVGQDNSFPSFTFGNFCSCLFSYFFDFENGFKEDLKLDFYTALNAETELEKEQVDCFIVAIELELKALLEGSLAGGGSSLTYPEQQTKRPSLEDQNNTSNNALEKIWIELCWKILINTFLVVEEIQLYTGKNINFRGYRF